MVTRAQFEAWFKEVSNWGRWGKDDELGTFNLITADKRKAAAALVRDGVSVSLSLELNKTADALNTNPFEQALTVGEFGGHAVAEDRYSVRYVRRGSNIGYRQKKSLDDVMSFECK
jgi:hypothetical protein